MNGGEQFGVAACYRCDPGPVWEVWRDWGAWPFVVSALVAFIAGRALSRSNLLLSLAALVAVAAQFYVGAMGKARFFHAIFDREPVARSQIERWVSEAYVDYAICFAVFALVPFGAAWSLRFIPRRKLKAVHA